MSKVTKKARLVLLSGLVLLGCGKKANTSSEVSSDTVHLNFLVHPSTMLLGATDTQVTDIIVQRYSCPDGSEPTDYNLKLVQAEKMFVLNEARESIEGCSIRLRGIKLNWKELKIDFTPTKDTLTSSGTAETVFANASKSAFLNVSIPAKVSVATEKNLFWPLIISYIDSKTRLFPIVAEAREPNVEPLGLTISALEDRGVVNTIWREFGISLSCGAKQTLGTCNGYDLMGLTARLVLQSDVDTGVAQQIRYQGGLSSLQFTAGLTHLVGSGLRFTIEMPLAYFGQKLFLILMKGQAYTVFAVSPELVPDAAK